MEKTIKSFTDLKVWQSAFKLGLEIYKLTKSFPKEELFALTSQLRRAAVSLNSNIAEGFSRQSYKEKLQFYSIALGSLTEIQSQLLFSEKLGYITATDLSNMESSYTELSKLLHGIIKKTKFYIQNS